MNKAWTRLGIPICIGIILLWLVKPGGSGFMPVPISHGTAPGWSMTNLDGTLLHSTNFAGRVLVVNFWATWCPPCIREIPDLQAFHNAHTNEGLTVIGVSVDEGGLAAVKGFVTRNQMTYPIVLANDAAMEGFAASGSIPTTFIVDRQGRFAARYVGALPRAELERVTAPLLAAPVR